MSWFAQATTKICGSYGEPLFEVVEALMKIDVIESLYLQNKGSSIEVQYFDHICELNTVHDMIENVLVDLSKDTDHVFVMFSVARDTYKESPTSLRRGIITVVKNGKRSWLSDFYDVDDEETGGIFVDTATALAEKLDSLLSPSVWESNIDNFNEQFGKGDFANAFTLKNKNNLEK